MKILFLFFTSIATAIGKKAVPFAIMKEFYSSPSSPMAKDLNSYQKMAPGHLMPFSYPGENIFWTIFWTICPQMSFPKNQNFHIENMGSLEEERHWANNAVGLNKTKYLIRELGDPLHLYRIHANLTREMSGGFSGIYCEDIDRSLK